MEARVASAEPIRRVVRGVGRRRATPKPPPPYPSPSETVVSCPFFYGNPIPVAPKLTPRPERPIPASPLTTYLHACPSTQSLPAAAVGRATYRLARRSPAVSGLPTSRSLAATARTPQCPGAEQRPLVPRGSARWCPCQGWRGGGGPRPLCPHPRYPNACMRPVYVLGCSLVHIPSHTAGLAPPAPWCCPCPAPSAARPVRGSRCRGSGVRFEGGPLTTRPSAPSAPTVEVGLPLGRFRVCGCCM